MDYGLNQVGFVAMDENGEVANEIEEEVEVCGECTKSAEKYLESHR